LELSVKTLCITTLTFILIMGYFLCRIAYF
jgi:hypothetical protein